jgi:hypothetical protein
VGLSTSNFDYLVIALITWRIKLIILQVISCLCFDYLVITLLYFDYLVHIAVFSTLGQWWLASIRSSWEAPTFAAYAGGEKLQPSPHRSCSLAPGGGFIRWLGGDVGGGSSSSFDTPGGSSSSDTRGGVVRWLPLGLLELQQRMPPRQKGELIWIISFQLFSTITKFTCSFLDSKVRKNWL